MSLNILNVLVACFVLVCSPCSAKQQNSLFLYLQDIEIQAETDEQRLQVKIAFLDMLTLSEAELKAKRYKDYQGKPDQWSITTLLHKHIVPISNFDREAFFNELQTPEVKESLRKIIQRFLADQTCVDRQ